MKKNITDAQLTAASNVRSLFEEGGRFYHLLNLCHVPRWSIVPVIRPQSVAEHTFRVAVIANALTTRAVKSLVRIKKVWEGNKYDHQITGLIDDVTAYALTHDMAEGFTGDIPAPAKALLAPHIDEDYSRLTEGVIGPARIEKPVPIHPWVPYIVGIADTIEALTYIEQFGFEGEMKKRAIRGMRGRLYEATKEGGDEVERTAMMGIVDSVLGDMSRWGI